MQTKRVAVFCIILICIIIGSLGFMKNKAIGASSVYDANYRFLGFMVASWDDSNSGMAWRYLLIYEPGRNRYLILDSVTGNLAEEQYAYYMDYNCSGQAYTMVQHYRGTILKYGPAYYEVLGGVSTGYIKSFSSNVSGSLSCTNIAQITSISYGLSPLRRIFTPAIYGFPVSLPLRFE